MSHSIEDLIPNDRRLADKTAVYGGSGTAFLNALNALDTAIIERTSDIYRLHAQLTASQNEHTQMQTRRSDLINSRIFSSNKNDWYKPRLDIVKQKFMLDPCDKIQPGQQYSFKNKKSAKKNKKSVKKNKKSAKKNKKSVKKNQ